MQDSESTPSQREHAFATVCQWAQQGDRNAQMTEAWCYEKGWGTERDMGKAIHLYQRIVEETQDPRAAFSLGFCHDNGIGIPADAQQAFTYYEMAATSDPCPAHAKTVTKAQYVLGYFFEKGKGGMPVDFRKAVHWYELAASQDSYFAQRALAFLYMGGMAGTCPPNFTKAFEYAVIAANNPSPERQDDTTGTIDLQLGMLYVQTYKGLTLDLSFEDRLLRALPYLQRAADAGQTKSFALLAFLHEQLHKVNKGCLEESFRWYLRAAEHGVTTAYYHVGVAYLKGVGTRVQKALAQTWLSKGASIGDTRCMYYLGNMCTMCIPTLEKVRAKTQTAVSHPQYQQAFGWYQRGAVSTPFREADPRAQLALALCYHLGHGVAPDPQRYVEWVERAVDNGNIKAVYHWGKIHEEGVPSIDRPIDMTKAFECYLRAAQSGVSEAQRSVAWFYQTGTIIPRNVSEAYHWYVQASQRGDIYAMYTLAKRFEEQNQRKEAVYWYEQAAQHGHRKSKTALGRYRPHSLPFHRSS